MRLPGNIGALELMVREISFMNIVTRSVQPDRKNRWSKNVKVGCGPAYGAWPGMTIAPSVLQTIRAEGAYHVLAHGNGWYRREEMSACSKGELQKRLNSHDFYILDAKIDESGTIGRCSIRDGRHVNSVVGNVRKYCLKLLLEKPDIRRTDKNYLDVRAWMVETLQ